MTPAARLVVLGSCRGVPEIHRVIEASHRAQVIATRGVGATQINDSILKALNTRLLGAEAKFDGPISGANRKADPGKAHSSADT